MAVLLLPVVRLNRALVPSAVLLLGYPPSGGGLTACTASGRTKQPSISGIRKRARHDDDDVAVFLNSIGFIVEILSEVDVEFKRGTVPGD